MFKEPGRGNVALELDGGHPDMDYVEHKRTYLLFLSFIKWGLGLDSNITTASLLAVLSAFERQHR